MAMTYEESRPRSNNVMYVRGIPFQCPDSGKGEQAKAAVRRPQPLDFCANRLFARRLAVGESGPRNRRSEAKAHAGLMTSRRAVRVFAEKAIPMRQLRALVLASCSGVPDRQTRMVQYVVVESQKVMTELAATLVDWLHRQGLGLDAADRALGARRVLLGGAPHLIVVHGAIDRPGVPEACARAVARLEWVAAAGGLGTCFAGELVQAALTDSAVAAAMTVPHGHTVYGILLVGLPATKMVCPEELPDTTIFWL